MKTTIEMLLGKKHELSLKIYAIEQVLEMFGYNENSVNNGLLKFDLPQKNEITEDTPIEKTNMSIRLCNLLKQCECVYVKDILNFTEYDFSRRRGFGAKMINEINAFLKENNLKR